LVLTAVVHELVTHGWTHMTIGTQFAWKVEADGNRCQMASAFAELEVDLAHTAG
jgi:hypothetical protein